MDIESLRARPGTRFKVVVYSVQSRVIQILERFSASETRRQSGILRLTFENTNAAFSAIMLNQIADVYIRQNIGRRSEEAELSLNFLNDELPKIRIRLDASEKALNEFRSRSKTMDISSEIRELLVKATAIEKLQLELDLKRREYIIRYDEAHPMMKGVVSQLAGVKAENEELLRRIGQLPLVEQDYIRLARDVQVNNQLYVSLLNNAQQLQIAKAGTTGNVSIVDRALVPEKPARPRKPLIAAIGALLGVILGFIVCQTLAVISKVVRDPKKLERDSGLPLLAIIPQDEYQYEVDQHKVRQLYLLSREKPNSSSVEALRSLRTSVLFRLSEKERSKVVLITSAVPAQGKSFVSVNLSYLFAASGKRVLLIEADIRLGTARNYLPHADSTQGLSTALLNGTSPAAAVIQDVYPNLDFLPAGPVVRNPGELLATDSMVRFINELAEQYDIVIVDSPPLLPVHDARSLGRAADMTLFIARQDSVNMTEIQDGIDVFSKSGNKIDGMVFNGFVPTGLRYGYGYGYGYGYRRYRYGTGRYGRKYRYGAYDSYTKE